MICILMESRLCRRLCRNRCPKPVVEKACQCYVQGAVETALTHWHDIAHLCLSICATSRHSKHMSCKVRLSLHGSFSPANHSVDQRKVGRHTVTANCGICLLQISTGTVACMPMVFIARIRFEPTATFRVAHRALDPFSEVRPKLTLSIASASCSNRPCFVIWALKI